MAVFYRKHYLESSFNSMGLSVVNWSPMIFFAYSITVFFALVCMLQVSVLDLNEEQPILVH